MKKILIFILLFFPLVVLCQESDVPLPVIIDGDEINYVQSQSRITAKGNVKLKYKDVELFCDQAVYDADSNKADLSGNIRIVREGSTIYGDNITYDFNTQHVQMLTTRMEFEPFYAEANKVERMDENQYVLNDGYITTCNLEDPHYRMTAQRVVVYPQRKIVAKNMVLKIGKIPILYIPYCVMPFNDKAFPVEVSPGKDSEWGYYMLTRWRYNMNPQNRGKVHLDTYENRGVGMGVTHNFESDNLGHAMVNYYYLQDELYKLENRKELFKEYPQRAGNTDKYLEDDRYRTQFAYSWQATDDFSILGEFHKFSDSDFMKDFFYREYEKESNPRSYFLADYNFSNSSLSLLAQKRANRFWSETEYLPQAEYNFYNQRLGVSDFYFESKLKAGSLTSKSANSGSDYNSLRVWGDNTLTYIKKFGWLNVTPYTGAYTAFYSKGYNDGENIYRAAHKSGCTISTKIFKIFDFNAKFLGEEIERMRHVLTPSLTYEYEHSPTVYDNKIFQFDGFDSLSRTESVKFTLDNKWQAKNRDNVWTMLYFCPWVDYIVHEEGVGSHFGSVHADLEVYPMPGISFSADSEYGLRYTQRAFTAVNTGVRFSDPEEGNYSLSLGHRYTRRESKESTAGLSCQITSMFRFTNYLRYDYVDKQVKEQQYKLRTDLHCWWMDLGVDINKDRDVTLWLIFTLKDFPDINLGFDHTYHGTRKEY